MDISVYTDVGRIENKGHRQFINIRNKKPSNLFNDKQKGWGFSILSSWIWNDLPVGNMSEGVGLEGKW